MQKVGNWRRFGVNSLATASPTSPTPRWIHVDINSYFASLLQQENPKLRGKPVGVVKSAGRSCVITASKEAKKLGVRTGAPLREARQLAPNLIVVPVNFEVCLSATYKLKQLFHSLAPNVEIFSLDEAFINLTDCNLLYPSSYQFAQLIQAKIKETLGEWVTCNAGLSYNRLLSKLTSEISPKGSITEINDDNRDAILAEVPFDAVCGVGMRLEKRLLKMGVTNPFQINFIPDEDLEREFGPYWKVELRKIGRGEEPAFLKRSAIALPHMKSVGRSITGYKLCNSEEAIKRILLNLTEEVIHKVRKLNLAGRLVYISCRGPDGQYWRAHRTLPTYIRHVPEMFHILYDELYSNWNRPWPVIKLSVRLMLLEPWAEVTPVLWPAWHQREKVYEAVDKINYRYGLFTVHQGGLVKDKIIKQEVTGFLGDKEYQLGRLG
jgi:DNA polymerase-4